ncbi:hypothetical protein CWO92_16830 [Heyndrickxia camelliae]|uniref:Uncharacterized protein n=1 Tax=Heyndrickxia camelliae TaxID=1707093 RepID=A0A2N3LH54_9BACI|nr:hypothetical protein CWO92_16830 [Heyndrickxia camelliae]
MERDKNGQIARRKEPEVVGKAKERAQSGKERARSSWKEIRTGKLREGKSPKLLERQKNGHNQGRKEPEAVGKR